MLLATLNLAQYFYLLGNTNPNNLTQILLLGVDANILLLGCGDVRNILFTLYCSVLRYELNSTYGNDDVSCLIEGVISSYIKLV